MWVRLTIHSKQSLLNSKTTSSRMVTVTRYKATLAANTQTNPHDKEALLRHAKPFDQIPGAKALPLLGTVWQVLPPFNKKFDVKNFYDLTVYQSKKYGPIWRDVIPFKGNMVNITSAEDTETVLRLDGKFPERGPIESLKKYREERIEQFCTAGLLATNAEEWWRVRSKAQQPMLKPQNTLMYLSSMAEVAEQMTARIRKIRNQENQVPGDFITEMHKWALESVSLVALDARLGCLDENAPEHSEPRKMIQAVLDSFDAMFHLEMGTQMYLILPTTKDWRKLVKAQDYFTTTSLKYIQKAMERSKAKSTADADGQLTMLEAMLVRGMSVKEAITMTIDMLMAGIDTTSNSTSFLFYLLSRNPDKQELLRREIDRVLPSKATVIEPSHLNDLHYLKACVKESLRLLPATIGFARTLQEDAVLSGYHVPKGTMIISHQQLMSRMEKYFPNPDDFIPERWIKGHPLASNGNPYTMLPFGFGTRACIGRRLAEQEMYLLTIKVLQNFRIGFNHPDLWMELRLVNTPNQPLRFTFADR